MNPLIRFVILISAGAFAAGCSCSHSDVPSAAAHISPRDSVCFNLGSANAIHLIETCGDDTSAIADYLLEVRARETDFRTRLRPSAADAYIIGFETTLSSRAPALAAKIF